MDLEVKVLINSQDYYMAMSELHWVRGYIEGLVFLDPDVRLPPDKESMRPAMDRMDSALAMLRQITGERLF